MGDEVPSFPNLQGVVPLRRHSSFDELSAYSQELGQKVEVAVTHAGSPVRELQRRVEAVASLRHESLQRTLMAEPLEGGRWAVLSEPAEGPTLTEVLAQSGPLVADDAVALVLALCRGLAVAHQAGVVHGGVSPNRVTLPGGLAALKPRLGGLALSPLLEPDSLPYRAPELAAGAAATPASDVYGLGGVLLATLTGAPPSKDSALPPGAEHLAAALRGALEAEPSKRLATVEALAQALAGVSGTQVSGGGINPIAVPAGVKALKQLGPWELQGLLGEGAMGQVFRARHSKLGRMAAIKLLRVEQYKRTDLIQRFFQEARTVNQINHEHIVEISDFAQEDGPEGPTAVYCVMELLTGQSLAQRLASGAVPLERSVHIARQVCQALAAAHKVGVVHRDVKVDNIFLIERRGDREYVKVLDFGVAKLTASADAQAPLISTMDGAIIGTPTAMAPEQASGGAVDHRVDVYAVGVVLYQLLSGKLPFDAENFARLVVKLMTQPPAPLPPNNPLGERVPAPLRALVLQCLEKDREARPASMEALEAALVAASAAPAAEPPRPSKQRPLRLAVGAGALVLVGLLGLWAAGLRQPAEVALPVPVEPPVPVAVEPDPTPAVLEPTPVEPAPAEPSPAEPAVDAGAAPVATPKPIKPVTLTPQIIGRVLTKEAKGVRECLSRFSTMLPGSAGSLQVQCTIERSGAVTTVNVLTPGLAPPLEACLKREVGRLKFPKNLGMGEGKKNTVTLPFKYDLRP